MVGQSLLALFRWSFMPDRYYSAEPIDGSTATLTDSEAHHLLHVMRAQPGLALTVFDGLGGEFAAEVVRCHRATVEVTLGPRQAIERELSFDLTLAVALPKGDRQRWLVEKAVELGVTRLLPLQATRSVAKMEKARKLSRYVIEASKQCGRNRLMEIAEPVDWSTLLTEAGTDQRLFAHPDGQPLPVTEIAPADSIVLAVGPEGGFTDEEVSQAIDAGWQTVSLGKRILRIETAALVLVSALTVR